MKVSIIIPTYNSKQFINKAIDSVISQTHKDIECVIVDGGSDDGTLDIIKEYKNKYGEVISFVSEEDKGIFDALNKGIKRSTGSVIGWIGADDFYASNQIIETAVNTIENKKVDICWGDLFYVSRDNSNKIIRNWHSSQYENGLFQRGWQIPHFSSFVRRKVFDQFGLFNLKFKIASDYDLFLRFLEKNRVSSYYINTVFVKMRTGGQSNRSLKNILKGNMECYKAWKENGLGVSFLKLFLPKPLLKLKQYISARKF